MRTPSVSGETLTPFLKNSDRGRVRAVFMLKCEAEAEAICKRSSGAPFADRFSYSQSNRGKNRGNDPK